MIFVSRPGSHRRRLLLPRTPAKCPSHLRFSTISRRQRFPATVAYDLTRFCRSRRAAHPLVLPTTAPGRCGAPCPCALTGGFGSAASRLAHADFLLPAPVPVERQRQRPPPLDLCGAPPARAAHNRVAAHSARPRVPERTPALGDHPRRLLDPVHRFHLRAQFGHISNLTRQEGTPEGLKFQPDGVMKEDHLMSMGTRSKQDHGTEYPAPGHRAHPPAA